MHSIWSKVSEDLEAWVMQCFLKYLYPCSCRHCHDPLEKHALLCTTCLSHLEPIEPSGDACDLLTQAACFASAGPIFSLIQRPDVVTAKLLASLLYVHLQKLNWPIPDQIFPLNPDLSRYLGKFTQLPIKRFRLSDKIVLIPTLRLLSDKQSNKILSRYPRQILNLSIIE